MHECSFHLGVWLEAWKYQKKICFILLAHLFIYLFIHSYIHPSSIYRTLTTYWTLAYLGAEIWKDKDTILRTRQPSLGRDANSDRWYVKGHNTGMDNNTGSVLEPYWTEGYCLLKILILCLQTPTLVYQFYIFTLGLIETLIYSFILSASKILKYNIYRIVQITYMNN